MPTKKVQPTKAKKETTNSQVKSPVQAISGEELTRRALIRDAIKRDLEAQFSTKNMKGTHYKNLIEDYVSLYDIKNELIDDIATRGVQVEYKNGENQYGTKKNESITELTRVNNQMLKILADLAKAAEIEVIEDDEL